MSLDAMKQALEALELLAKWEHPASNITTKNGGRIYPHRVASDAAAALRAAIEQPRRWQDLTEFEKVNIAIDCGCADVAWMDFADAIEAKLKEKNA